MSKASGNISKGMTGCKTGDSAFTLNFKNKDSTSGQTLKLSTS